MFVYIGKMESPGNYSILWVSCIMWYVSPIRVLEKHTFKCQGNANDHRVLQMHESFLLLTVEILSTWFSFGGGLGLGLLNFFSALPTQHSTSPIISRYQLTVPAFSQCFAQVSHLGQSHPPNDLGELDIFIESSLRSVPHLNKHSCQAMHITIQHSPYLQMRW